MQVAFAVSKDTTVKEKHGFPQLPRLSKLSLKRVCGFWGSEEAGCYAVIATVFMN